MNISVVLEEKLISHGFTSKRVELLSQHRDLQDRLFEFESQMERKGIHTKRRLSGSYAEIWGINLRNMNGLPGKGSDIDIMYIAAMRIAQPFDEALQKAQFVLEKTNCNANTINDTENIIYFEDVRPGFVKLITQNKYTSTVKDFLLSDSSKINNHFGYNSKIAGPAFKLGDEVEFDLVFSLKCKVWPTSTTQFFERHRKSNWPNEQLLLECRKSDCCLVFKVYDNFQNINERRYSFSMAEKILLRNFSTKQGLIFVCAKYILKHLIVPEFNRQLPNSNAKLLLSSYQMKTIILWISEQICFDEMDLLFGVSKMLSYFNDCINSKDGLQSYFISGYRILNFNNDYEKQVLSLIIHSLIVNLEKHLTDYFEYLSCEEDEDNNFPNIIAVDPHYELGDCSNLIITTFSSNDVSFDIFKIHVLTSAAILLLLDNYHVPVSYIINELESINGNMTANVVLFLKQLVNLRNKEFNDVNIEDNHRQIKYLYFPEAISVYEASEYRDDQFFDKFVRQYNVVDNFFVHYALKDVMPAPIQHWMNYQFHSFYQFNKVAAYPQEFTVYINIEETLLYFSILSEEKQSTNYSNKKLFHIINNIYKLKNASWGFASLIAYICWRRGLCWQAFQLVALSINKSTIPNESPTFSSYWNFFYKAYKQNFPC